MNCLLDQHGEGLEGALLFGVIGEAIACATHLVRELPKAHSAWSLAMPAPHIRRSIVRNDTAAARTIEWNTAGNAMPLE
jgi:hypothetical protein